MLQLDAPCALLARWSLTDAQDLRLQTILALRAIHDERTLKKSVTSKKYSRSKAHAPLRPAFSYPLESEEELPLRPHPPPPPPPRQFRHRHRPQLERPQRPPPRE